MNDRANESWCRNVDAIIRGARGRLVRLGVTPAILRRMGLSSTDLMMSAGKIATVRREHPEVTLEIWYSLLVLLSDPFAIFPSKRDDGSIVVAITILDVDGSPVVVPILPGEAGQPNIVLSIYGKFPTQHQTGHQWIEKQIANAKREGKPYYLKNGSADSVPKPGSAEAIPSSPGSIPADGSTEPRRGILKLRKKSSES